MKSKRIFIRLSVAASLVAVSAAAIYAGPDKYTVKVTNGLGFADFRGYESWQLIAVSHNGDHIAAILGNPATIAAYQAGIPANGKPFPDGAKMAKIHWMAVKDITEPGAPTIPGPQHDAAFMLKDSKRFADSGGWGYAEFQYDAPSNTFRPSNLHDTAPQANDAKCGFACHTAVKNRDYVFTRYGTR